MKTLRNPDREGGARHSAAPGGDPPLADARGSVNGTVVQTTTLPNPDREGGARHSAAPDGDLRLADARANPPLADARGSEIGTVVQTTTLPTPDRMGGERKWTSYLITWVCYGTWLPGREGAISRKQNRVGSPVAAANETVEKRSARRMLDDRYKLDAVRREIVLKSLQQVCELRGWKLLAAHVRSNHVHIVVTAPSRPEHVMNSMKAYASRALNQASFDETECRRWARHGSTRYLWTEEAIRRAIRYVIDDQGQQMAVHESNSPC